jgi:outer membrane protein TolC
MATKISSETCLMNDAIVDPGQTAWGPFHSSSGPLPWIAGTPFCLIIVLLLMAGGVIFWCPSARGADPSPAQNVVPGNPLTFDEAVKIAIGQSPYFTKSSLEIDIRRMDETDSRYGMVPPLTFRTMYYVNQPNGLNNKPYSLSFSTAPYNPFGSYFLLQAQKIVSQIAILTHISVISKGLDRLGQNYLEIDCLKKMAVCQQEMVSLARERLTYMQNRLSIGTATSLDVKVAQQELQLAQGEQEGIALSQKRSLNGLRGFLGLPPTQEINPDLQDCRRQVLGTFDPDVATAAQAKNRSYEMKIFDLQKQIQGYNIKLAIAKVFPTILFNTQTPDPLSVTTSRGLYVGLGLEFPVWDGFKRVRDISRQKAMSRQIDAQKEAQADSLEDKWLDKMNAIHEKAVALKYARSREDLARLKMNQTEVRYQAGEVQLPAFLDSRNEVLMAQKETLNRGLQHDKTVLALREISGDLGNSYVDSSSWQN